MILISTHTLRGERDAYLPPTPYSLAISTHTLRGERDLLIPTVKNVVIEFQLTRSVGSVTAQVQEYEDSTLNFNSHAPWGA